ncbi:MAG TPA: hypothetical protein ENJ95_15860 [Bacteroidetes bacterium]|nr:hypothetical protein [Bacteroidota bacterium]
MKNSVFQYLLIFFFPKITERRRSRFLGLASGLVFHKSLLGNLQTENLQGTPLDFQAANFPTSPK